jgi:hypothetical protein
VLAGCGSPNVELTQQVTHPVYGVQASLPLGWVADASHDDVYPADVWRLHPADGGVRTGVTLILAWQPRGGRHSAGFPGGDSEDSHAATRVVGGLPRNGTAEDDDSRFLVDFDAGELAVSISTFGTSEADRHATAAVLAHLSFDDLPVPEPTPQRRALDHVRAWATEHGFPTDGIVYVGAPPNDTRHAFTLFHDRGLVPLRVDANGNVERMSL